MAWYKYGQFLQVSASGEYDKVFAPGALVPHSGIYRCDGCGREIACNANNPFPPQNHHQHGIMAPPILWRLIVFADGTPKS
jgi:hypothetical protein